MCHFDTPSYLYNKINAFKNSFLQTVCRCINIFYIFVSVCEQHKIVRTQ